MSNNIDIGDFCKIYPDVEIGDGTIIENFCVLGGGPLSGRAPLRIGPNSRIRSHSVIYAGSSFESRLETGHHVVIRENTKAGHNLRVGNFSDIEGDCSFGDFCRLHGYVHVGKGSSIGNFVWLFSLTTATNDPLPPSHLAESVTLGDGCVVCVGATLMPGCELGVGAFVTAGTRVNGKIEAGAVVSGAEGCTVCHVSNLAHIPSGTRHPWMKHFADAYPVECHERLDSLRAKIMENKFDLRTQTDYPLLSNVKS